MKQYSVIPHKEDCINVSKADVYELVICRHDPDGIYACCLFCDAEVPIRCQDSNVERNRELLIERSLVGVKKYNTTTEREDVGLEGWLIHAQEEALDFANYLQAAQTTIRKDKELFSAKVENERGTSMKEVLENVVIGCIYAVLTLCFLVAYHNFTG